MRRPTCASEPPRVARAGRARATPYRRCSAKRPGIRCLHGFGAQPLSVRVLFQHKLHERRLGRTLGRHRLGRFTRWIPFDRILQNRALRLPSRRAQERRRWPLSPWPVRPHPEVRTREPAATPGCRHPFPTRAPTWAQVTRARTTRATGRAWLAPPSAICASRSPCAAPEVLASRQARAVRHARASTAAPAIVSWQASHALPPSPAAPGPATAARGRPTRVSDRQGEVARRPGRGFTALAAAQRVGSVARS